MELYIEDYKKLKSDSEKWIKEHLSNVSSDGDVTTIIVDKSVFDGIKKVLDKY